MSCVISFSTNRQRDGPIEHVCLFVSLVEARSGYGPDAMVDITLQTVDTLLSEVRNATTTYRILRCAGRQVELGNHKNWARSG